MPHRGEPSVTFTVVGHNVNRPRVLVMNGPNLNLLGVREKELYGTLSLEDINRELAVLAQKEGVEISFYQSNHEGELVDCIHQAMGNTDAIIINAGALTHYSVSLLDALKAVEIPFLEVHLTNIYAREAFRHHSLLSPAARGGIFGLGPDGYFLALQAVCQWFK